MPKSSAEFARARHIFFFRDRPRNETALALAAASRAVFILNLQSNVVEPPVNSLGYMKCLAELQGDTYYLNHANLFWKSEGRAKATGMSEPKTFGQQLKSAMAGGAPKSQCGAMVALGSHGSYPKCFLRSPGWHFGARGN